MSYTEHVLTFLCLSFGLSHSSSFVFSIGPSSEVVHGSEYSLGTHVGRILKGTLHDNHPAVQRFDLLYMYLHNPDLCWQLNDSEQSSLQCVSE